MEVDDLHGLIHIIKSNTPVRTCPRHVPTGFKTVHIKPMIKRILSLSIATAAGMALNYVAAESVTLTEAGTLKNLISAPASVTSLTVSGPLNAADFDFINRKMPKLSVVDLADASIVAYSGTAVLTGYSTSPADELPAYALHGMGITSLVLPTSVTAIGEGSLAGISAVSLSLPGVTTVGEGAFAGAVKLESVALSQSSTITLGQQAFAGCSSLSSVSLNADIIPAGAFKNCTSLTSAAFPASLKSIGSNAFMGCTSLAQFAFGESIAEIGEGAFEGSGIKGVELSGCTALKSIGAWAFAKCPELASVTMPESLTEIGKGAFFDDPSLTSIDLPSGITNVEDFVLTNTSGVTTGNIIPADAEIIGQYAYKGMSGVTHLDLPAGLTYIGDNAMEGMVSLREIEADKTAEVPALGKEVWKDVNQPEIFLMVSDSDKAREYAAADQWKEFKIETPSGAQDIVINDSDLMADIRVSFEGQTLVVVAPDGLRTVVAGDINGVLVPASTIDATRATFDTSGMGQDLYTIKVTTADGRTGSFKMLRK